MCRIPPQREGVEEPLQSMNVLTIDRLMFKNKTKHACSFSVRVSEKVERRQLTLAVYDDERREILDVDLPHCLHPQLRVLQHLHLEQPIKNSVINRARYVALLFSWAT